ncbi:ACL-2 protein [Aphelenchoides avenae]|nr:ACL-2 protein [Aphelenchus avenae]
MAWADILNDSPVWPWILLAVIQISLLYANSHTARYYVRMFGLWLCVFFSGVLALIPSIPVYFKQQGACVALACLRYTTFWLDVDVEVRDQIRVENLSEAGLTQPCVIVANHQSSLDLFVMSKVWPQKCTVMLKSSLKWIPIWNLSAVLANSIFVDRARHEKAQEALKKAADAIVNKNMKIWVFPEGTRNADHKLLPFKKGAFNIAVFAQIPIIPVVISDYKPFYSKGEKYFHSNGEIVVQVLDPVSTKGLNQEDVPELADRIRDEMVKVYDDISEEARQKFEAHRAA